MKSKGFTLIELMVTVAIIGIISSIAYPSYVNYITRAKRTECRAALMQIMQQQERYFTQQNTYLPFTSAAANIPMKQFSGDSAASSACTLSAAACDASAADGIRTCVRVTGTPVRSDPVVGNITLSSDGSKGCSGTDSTKCWTN